MLMIKKLSRREKDSFLFTINKKIDLYLPLFGARFGTFLADCPGVAGGSLS